MSRFEVHSHTHFSNIRLLDCINTPEKLVEYAHEIGLKGICITDHEALGSHMEIDRLIKKWKEIDPEFKIGRGNEIYLTETRDKNQKYYHFILLAADTTGHRMLRELSSIAWSNSYYDRGMERVPTLKSELKEIVERFGKGHLIGASACLGSEVDHCLLEMDKANVTGNTAAEAEWGDRLTQHIEYCIDVFGKDNFYLEVQPAKSKEQMIVNKRMQSLADFFGLKIIVTTDAHYLKKEDREIHKAYLNSKNGEREVDEFYAAAYLQTTEEVIENLAGTGLDYYELEKNTHEIYDKMQDYSLTRKQHVPQVDVPDYPKRKGDTGYPVLDSLLDSDNPQERYWVNYCLNKLKEFDLYNETYLSRLEEEADIQKVISDKLETCMFSYPIFLQHYIDMFWEVGSTVGAGRGSACAGLNHYLLGITQLDPIKYDLPYWRYLNKDRIELGDIDIDICPSKREEIFARIREERGQLGCIQVCTYGTETTRSAIATACRGYRSDDFRYGIDSDVAQYMTSLIPVDRGFIWPINDVVNGNKEKGRKPVTKFVQEVNKYPGLLDIIKGIEGLINHRGIHASGVNFYGEDPYETACFMKAANGAIITQYSLHDAEAAGDVKYDFLVTEIQDVITQCLHILQENEQIENDLSLRELYNKYLHPDILPIEDDKMWETLHKGKVLKLFQFDSQVGGQTVKTLRPTTPYEMANCNSIMRLMASEKGGETPTERYKRMKRDMSQWYEEMNRWGLTKEEQKILEKYYLDTYATPGQQEDLMLILMDKDICGFTLAEANAARKIVGKKQMDKIPELEKKVLDSARSKNLGEYIWKTAAGPQMGYSFSKIHSLAYSFIGLQTVYLASYFDPIYWNTACLRVDSGLDEDASTNYGKIASAVGNIIDRGINVSLIDINRSGYLFEPDYDNNQILFGMKGLNGVGGEIIQQIIDNRPYEGLLDFMNKVKCNKTVMIALIKSGAFDQFGKRFDIMKQYISIVSEPKKRITMQNFNGLNERGLIPDELDFQKRVFAFNKALRKKLVNEYYILDNEFYEFYEEFFDVDLLEIKDNQTVIKKTTWKTKCYDKAMAKAKEYVTANKEKLLEKLNQALFQEVWDKYAAGSISKWEMDSLGFYYHPHELLRVKKSSADIKEFNDLPLNPIVAYTFKRNGIEIPIFETVRIMGTVIAKDDLKSSISLLTVNSGVVTVKFNRDYFAKYNKRISEPMPDGTKKVREASFFQRGTLVVVNGFRRGDIFFTKSYKKTQSHQLYKITNINEDGTLQMTNQRWDEIHGTN